MDPAKYKTVLTTRGFTYNYYFAAAATPSKPTILFCHGFPSTSSHWRREALFFEERGYGVVVPDMLGYGGTSKPTDTDDYLPSKVSRDIIDILDAEAIGKAIAVGHDWGSTAVSRLANHFPERFLAYAFFAVPYVPVRPPAPYEQLLALSKAKYGYELYGYWEYLASDEFETDFRAHKSMQDNYSAPLAQYITEEDKKETIAGFLENGFRGPTRWYDVLITNKAAKDNIATIPEQRRFPPVTAPIFFGAAKHDKASVPQQGYDVFASPPFKNHSVTLREFDGDHWIILSCAEEINRELLRWIEESVVATSLKASL